MGGVRRDRGYPTFICRRHFMLLRERHVVPWSVMLEILNGFFMRHRCVSRGKGSQIPALSGLSILLVRVQPILVRLQFPNHRKLLTVLNPSRKLNLLFFLSGW